MSDTFIVNKEDDLVMPKHQMAMQNLIEIIRALIDNRYDRSFANYLNLNGISDNELIWCGAFDKEMLYVGDD